jgi:glucokinase
LQQGDLDQVLKTKMPALGIDLGGTKIMAALVCDMKVLGEPRRVPTPKGASKIIDVLIELVSEFQKEHLLAGVGIATAGIVRVDTGEVIGSTGNLPGWEGTAIKKIIEGRTMLPVHVENDANAAAYGEAKAAGLADKLCAITVTLGTGIGGGIVFNGRLYRGAHWAAGEIGHIRIAVDNRRLCTCGLWDCWEAYASGRGFRDTARETLSSVTADQSALASLKPEEVTTEGVFAAAAEGDIIARRIVNTWHEHVCSGLSTLAHTLDPDCFLISGGMSKFVDYDLIHELLVDRTLPRVGEKLSVRPASLGVTAGLIGAGQLVLDELLAGVS